MRGEFANERVVEGRDRVSLEDARIHANRFTLFETLRTYYISYHVAMRYKLFHRKGIMSRGIASIEEGTSG